jgi:hypothetical protein
VVDRIVDGVTAVLLVEPDDEELDLPADQLPDGAVDGTWVRLDRGTEPPRILGIDHERTEARRADIAERMQRLRQQRRGGRFDRDD